MKLVTVALRSRKTEKKKLLRNVLVLVFSKIQVLLLVFVLLKSSTGASLQYNYPKQQC